VATFPWNGWQLWRGLGGNLRLEYAIDLEKTVFHAVELAPSGQVLSSKSMRRKPITEHFAQSKPSVVAMEAYPGDDWLARKLREQGHEPMILPAQYVKPFA